MSESGQRECLLIETRLENKRTYEALKRQQDVTRSCISSLCIIVR